MKMIGSDYVLEAHNIFHTTEASALEFISSLDGFGGCKLLNETVFLFRSAGGWRWLLQWGWQLGAGTEGRQFDGAQW